jgi:hypothetical protein
MKKELKMAFEREMGRARFLYGKGQLDRAFKHLETAHVLGQRYLAPHIRSHWWMLRIGLRRRSVPEVSGQAVRMVLGAVGSAVGVVPTGNSGGTDVSMFARRPVEPGIASLLDQK